MALFTFLLISVSVALLAVFFSSDADLLLFMLPDPTPAKLQETFGKQVVWVVGASGGIGAALAKDFVKTGAQVVLSARREPELRALAEESKQYGLEPYVVPLDVTKFEDHAAAFEMIVKQFGKVDVLVLNAGRSQRDLAVDTPLSVTTDMMKLNFFSFVALNNIVMPSMIERKSGQVVVIGSIAGVLPASVSSSYSASKFALRGYFGALRSEVSMHNVKVSVVSPGPVESDIFSNAYKSEKLPQSESEKKMSTTRCSYLIVKGCYYELDETYIAEQPFLLFPYMATYTPALFRVLLNNVLGPARVKAFLTGGDVYSLSKIMKQFAE